MKWEREKLKRGTAFRIYGGKGDRFFFQVNGNIWLLHLEIGRLLTITMGEKKRW